MKNFWLPYLFFTCILLSTPTGLNAQVIMDELNGSTLGLPYGVTYTTTPNGQGALFSIANETRIEYPFSMGLPHEGTIEMLVYVTQGYHYDNFVLQTDQYNALIFNTVPSDVWYAGAMWVFVADDGGVWVETANGTGGSGGAHFLTATGTSFHFNQWHVVSFSYGSEGQYLMVDGLLVASDPTYTLPMQACGNWGSDRDIPNVGESHSIFWANDQYDSGFEGMMDRFRASNDQQDWVLNNPSAPTLISPSQGQNIITDAITFSWTAVSGATRYELYVDNNSGLGSPEISKQNIPELQNLTATSYTISGNWLSGNTYYWKVIAIKAGGNIESPIGTFQYIPPQLSQPDWVPFYRTFNSNVVDHFYCSSTQHQLIAISQNYHSEGTEGYVSLHPFTVNSPDTLRSIYRFYIPNSLHPKGSCHYYTTNEADKDNRIIQGWMYEGITGYGYNRCHGELTKLYHTWLNQSTPDIRMDNFYTISETEKNNSISLYNYSDQGYICYISATGQNTTVPWNDNAIEFGLGINPQNGNFSNPSGASFSIPEGKVSLNFAHFYTSSAVRFFNNVSPLGNGWNHSYNMTMSFTDSTIYLFWPGEINLFDRITYQPKTKGVYDILTQVTSTKFQVKKKDQSVYTFEILYPVTNGTAFLTSIKDRNNNIINLSYNDKGWLKWVKSPANRYIAFSYYPSSDTARYGLIHFIKDSLALNRSIEFSYDLNRNLTQFKDAKNQITSYGYTQSLFDHFLTSITYPDGSKITNIYDSLSRRIFTQNFDYQDSSRLIHISVPTATHVQIRDQQDNPVDIDFMAGIGNITQLTTPSGHSNFEYNDLSNPTLPSKITDGDGYITTVSYDSRGNPLMIRKPHGNIHQYEYNVNNDVTKYTNPRNKVTNFGYIGVNLTSIQSPRGYGLTANTLITYNTYGDLLTKTNPLNQTTTFTYNGYHNLSSVTDNLVHITTYGYDAASRVISKTNAKNQTSTTVYDNNDLVTSSIDANNKTTSYGYNFNDALTGVTDAKSHTTSMSYNNVTGLLVTMTDQLSHQSHFTYWDNGQLHTFQNRNGQTLNYSYDSGNRLHNVTSPSINKVFSYDLNDIVTGLSDGYGQLSMLYDSLNRLTTSTDNFQQKTVSYQYDPANNITRIIYPGNKAVDYTYYDDNRLYTVKDWNNNITAYFYLSDGSLDSARNANGTTTKYSYDGAGRLTRLVNRKSNGTVINSYNYTLDNIGNQTSVVQNEPITPPVINPGSSSYTYDNANRIIGDGSATFGFDNDGNMTSKNDNGITTYSYNAEDILTSASGLLNSGFTYDGLGNRRIAVRNGITTRYVLDISGSMSNVLMETDAAGTAQNYYIYGLGIVSRIKASDNSTGYYHYDSRGSTIAISDQSGNITHKYAYDAFGSVVQKVETDFNPFRYVGKYGVMYEDSNLYFMHARYYSPKIGRFLSEDPIWNVNLYSYANNNPLSFIDPLGLGTQGFNIPNPYNTQGSCSIANYEKTRKRLLEQLKRYQEESANETRREKRLKMAQDLAKMVKEVSEISASFLPYGGFLSVMDNAVLAVGLAVQGDDKGAEEASLNIAIDLVTAGFGSTNFKSFQGLTSEEIIKKITKSVFKSAIQDQTVKVIVHTTNK